MRAMLTAILACLPSLALAQQPLIVAGMYGKQPAVYRLFLGTHNLQSLKAITLDGVHVEVDTKANTGSPLRLNGTIERGRYAESSGLAFDGRLALSDPFMYERGDVNVTLASGSFRVTVRGSTLGNAVLLPDVLISVEIEGSDDDLELSGKLDGSGRLNPDGGIDIDARLDLVPAFTYSKDPVVATLTGGRVGVQISDGRFRSADLDDVQIGLLIQAEDSKGLELHGSTTGRYSDGGVTMDASLNLIEAFEYRKGDVRATFMPGAVQVEIREDDHSTIFTGTLIDGTVASVRLDPIYLSWMSAAVELENVQIPLAPELPPAPVKAVLDIESRTNTDRPEYRVIAEHLGTATLQFTMTFAPEHDDIRRWLGDVAHLGEIDLLRPRDVTIAYVDPATKRNRSLTLINARPETTVPGNSTDSLYVVLQYTGLKLSH